MNVTSFATELMVCASLSTQYQTFLMSFKINLFPKYLQSMIVELHFFIKLLIIFCFNPIEYIELGNYKQIYLQQFVLLSYLSDFSKNISRYIKL